MVSLVRALPTSSTLEAAVKLARLSAPHALLQPTARRVLPRSCLSMAHVRALLANTTLQTRQHAPLVVPIASSANRLLRAPPAMRSSLATRPILARAFARLDNTWFPAIHQLVMHAPTTVHAQAQPIVKAA